MFMDSVSAPFSCMTCARAAGLSPSAVDFRKAEARIAVVGLLTQHPLIVGNRRLAVAALLRPVGQRQVIAY